MQNSLFFRESSRESFGEARERLEDVLAALSEPDRRVAGLAGQQLSRFGNLEQRDEDICRRAGGIRCAHGVVAAARGGLPCALAGAAGEHDRHLDADGRRAVVADR
jgi:hypothetical protein